MVTITRKLKLDGITYYVAGTTHGYACTEFARQYLKSPLPRKLTVTLCNVKQPWFKSVRIGKDWFGRWGYYDAGHNLRDVFTFLAEDLDRLFPTTICSTIEKLYFKTYENNHRRKISS